MKYNQIFLERKSSKPLTPEELQYYFEKYKFGDLNARQIIIDHNMRLVKYIAKKFKNTPYELEDLISIGTIGLIKSVDSFDLSKNIKFVTYASRCIENEILLFLKSGKKWANNVSLETSVAVDPNGNELKISDILADESSDFVLDYEKIETHLSIREIVENLPKLEKEVIQLQFGFIEDKLWSQQEVADKLGFSQSYISRITIRTLRKIQLQLIKQKLIEIPPKSYSPKKIYRTRKLNYK